MSFREITQLRKEGHLQEALEMAENDLKARRDEWSLRAIFWVYRDLCNHHLSLGNLQETQTWLLQAEAIYDELGEDEIAEKALRHLRKAVSPHYQLIKQMAEFSKEGKTEEAYLQVKALLQNGSLHESLHEEYGWILFRYLKQHFAEMGSVESRKTLFEYIKLSNPRPSLLHSQMLLLASQISEAYPDLKFIPFIQLWGTDHFREEDFQDSTSNGVSYAPLITRIIDRCFKMGYHLDEITDVFAGVHDMTEEKILFLCSRHYFFEIIKRRSEPIKSFGAVLDRYLDETKEKGTANPFHSKILQAICWRQKDHQDIHFKKDFERWGMNRLMEEDWARTTSEKGDVHYPSLAEKAIKYYKEALENAGGMATAANSFRLLIEKAVEKYPEDTQYLRLLGQYLFSHNEREEAISIYKKLLTVLNKFYVWDELAQMLEDKLLKLSAWCKALSCGEKEEFLGKIHLSLAQLLVEERQYGDAAQELRKVAETYKRNGWKMPGAYYMTERSIDETSNADTKRKFDYTSHIREIEEFVFGEYEWEPMCVIDIFKNKYKKKRIRLTAGENKTMVINPRVFSALTHVRQGQVVEVRTIGGKVMMVRIPKQSG